MRRVLGVLMVVCALAACAPGALIGRDDVLKKASHEKGVTNLQRREAKLMMWDEFLKVSGVSASAQARPPGKQRVWVVAESGDLQVGSSGGRQHWAIFVYNAVSGSLIGFVPGPTDAEASAGLGSPEWPDYWGRFPNSG
ncbi:MAG: hypothetical protein M3Z97_07425 [Candidatus Dormibacteraeota bacterium]|nr:hypothetical protein [Candidatus Dormibacteraeota bacterium]